MQKQYLKDQVHPQYSVAYRTTFIRNSLKLSFSIPPYQTLISLWMNFVPLFFRTLLQFIEVRDTHSCTALLRSCYSRIEVWTLTGPLQLLDSFLVLALMLHFRSLSCWMTQFQYNQYKHIFLVIFLWLTASKQLYYFKLYKGL